MRLPVEEDFGSIHGASVRVAHVDDQLRIARFGRLKYDFNQDEARILLRDDHLPLLYAVGRRRNEHVPATGAKLEYALAILTERLGR
jgi:hypothetical protein